MQFKTRYEGRKAIKLSFEGSEPYGKTEQAHKASCDINSILKQYDRTGLITHVNRIQAEYGDYTAINEYQQSLNLVIKAQADFDALPSAIRKRFGFDPGLFVEFVTNPSNQDEMIRLGLAVDNRPPVVAPAEPSA